MKKCICFLLIAICLTGCAHYDQSDIDDAYQKGKEDGWFEGYEEGYTQGHLDGYNEAEDSYLDIISDDEEHTYVINKSSKKFHKPTCDSVSQMKESNKEVVVCKRAKLIEDGYSPCQQCNP